MSHEATTWARAQVTGSGPAKFILMLLADQAGSDHSCWPSLAYLSKISEMGESTIRAATKRLAEQGLIRVYYRHRASGLRRSCRYQLMVDGPETAEPETVDWASHRRSPEDDNRSEPAEDMRSERAEEALGASGSVRSERADIPYKEPSVVEPLALIPGAARTANPKATRIPENFQPDEKMRAWFAEEKLAQIIDGRTEHEKFCDYWRAQPGVKGRKLDWAATWRNWMRTAAERAPRRAGNALTPVSGAPVNYRPSTGDLRVEQGRALFEKYSQMESMKEQA